MQGPMERQALAVLRAQTVCLVEMAHLALLVGTAWMAQPVLPDPAAIRAYRARLDSRARTERLVRRGVPESEASKGLRAL